MCIVLSFQIHFSYRSTLWLPGSQTLFRCIVYQTTSKFLCSGNFRFELREPQILLSLGLHVARNNSHREKSITSTDISRVRFRSHTLRQTATSWWRWELHELHHVYIWRTFFRPKESFRGKYSGCELPVSCGDLLYLISRSGWGQLHCTKCSTSVCEGLPFSACPLHQMADKKNTRSFT